MANAALALGPHSGQPCPGSHDGATSADRGGDGPPGLLSPEREPGVLLAVPWHSGRPWRRPRAARAESREASPLAPTRCTLSPADAFQGKGRAGHVAVGRAGCWWSLHPKQGLRRPLATRVPE